MSERLTEERRPGEFERHVCLTPQGCVCVCVCAADAPTPPTRDMLQAAGLGLRHWGRHSAPGRACVCERCVRSCGTGAVHAVLLDLCPQVPLFWALNVASTWQLKAGVV